MGGLLAGLAHGRLRGGGARVRPTAGQGPAAAVEGFAHEQQGPIGFAEDDRADIGFGRQVARLGQEQAFDLRDGLARAGSEHLRGDGADGFVTLPVVRAFRERQPVLRDALETPRPGEPRGDDFGERVHVPANIVRGLSEGCLSVR